MSTYEVIAPIVVVRFKKETDDFFSYMAWSPRRYGPVYTYDLIVEIEDKLWLIDFKTSNHIQPTYELQTAIYGKCYEECYGKKVDNYGILWLKSSKRKANKEKMQGKGWEMVLSTRTQEENIDIFKTVKRLFDLENPNEAPVFTEFKTSVRKEA